MREIITFIIYLLLAAGYTLYSDGTLETFGKAFLTIVLIQFSSWALWTIYGWTNYLLVRKKHMVKTYYDNIKHYGFPRILKKDPENEDRQVLETNPESYLFWIVDSANPISEIDFTGIEFDIHGRLFAKAMLTEFECLETVGEYQVVKREKMAFEIAIKAYCSLETGSLWEVVPRPFTEGYNMVREVSSYTVSDIKADPYSFPTCLKLNE